MVLKPCKTIGFQLPTSTGDHRISEPTTVGVIPPEGLGLTASPKVKVLRFVTSCSRAPLLGFSHLQPPFTIHKVRLVMAGVSFCIWFIMATRIHIYIHNTCSPKFMYMYIYFVYINIEILKNIHRHRDVCVLLFSFSLGVFQIYNVWQGWTDPTGHSNIHALPEVSFCGTHVTFWEFWWHVDDQILLQEGISSSIFFFVKELLRQWSEWI